MDVDTAMKDHQEAGTEEPKPKRTTRSSASGAKAKLPDACPNPTHDDFETVLINGDPVVPPTKAKTKKKKARVTSKPYVEISGDEGAPANPSTPVVPAKTRVKSRAAKKAVIGPSDDEDEIIELPKDPQGSGMVGKGKRKQQDNSVGGVASEHQPKRPRPTPRQTSVIDADVLDVDTLEGHVDITRERAPTTLERHRALDGERALMTLDGRAPVTDERAPLDKNERDPTPICERHRNVKGERAIATCGGRAPIANERAPTVDNGRAPTSGERAIITDNERAPTSSERAITARDERAPITKERAPIVDNERVRTAGERAPIVDDGRALERFGERFRKFDGGDRRAPIGDGERDPVPFRDEHRNVIGERALDTYEERASMTDARVALDGDGTTPAVNRETTLVDGGEWASRIQVTVCDPDRADLQLKTKWCTLPKIRGIRRSALRG